MLLSLHCYAEEGREEGHSMSGGGYQLTTASNNLHLLQGTGHPHRRFSCANYSVFLLVHQQQQVCTVFAVWAGKSVKQSPHPTNTGMPAHLLGVRQWLRTGQTKANTLASSQPQEKVQCKTMCNDAHTHTPTHTPTHYLQAPHAER